MAGESAPPSAAQAGQAAIASFGLGGSGLPNDVIAWAARAAPGATTITKDGTWTANGTGGVSKFEPSAQVQAQTSGSTAAAAKARYSQVSLGKGQGIGILDNEAVGGPTVVGTIQDPAMATAQLNQMNAQTDYYRAQTAAEPGKNAAGLLSAGAAAQQAQVATDRLPSEINLAGAQAGAQTATGAKTGVDTYQALIGPVSTKYEQALWLINKQTGWTEQEKAQARDTAKTQALQEIADGLTANERAVNAIQQQQNANTAARDRASAATTAYSNVSQAAQARTNELGRQTTSLLSDLNSGASNLPMGSTAGGNYARALLNRFQQEQSPATQTTPYLQGLMNGQSSPAAAPAGPPAGLTASTPAAALGVGPNDSTLRAPAALTQPHPDTPVPPNILQAVAAHAADVLAQKTGMPPDQAQATAANALAPPPAAPPSPGYSATTVPLIPASPVGPMTQGLQTTGFFNP